MQVKCGDAEIFYEVMGSGPPVVLLHPFPVNHGFWVPVAELLASRYTFILPDLRGLGTSGVGDGPATMEKHAEDVVRVCDTAGVGKAVFAGVSIGGYVLLEFWRRYRQRVQGLVLCDTKAQADNEEARSNRLKAADEVEKYGVEPFLDSLFPKLVGESTQRNRPDLVATARAMAKQATPRGIAELQRGMAARPDSVPTLRTIDVPTLLLFGEEDVLSPPSDGQLMRQHIPRSNLHVIAKAGHFAVFEQHFEAFRLIRPFLGLVSGKEPSSIH